MLFIYVVVKILFLLKKLESSGILLMVRVFIKNSVLVIFIFFCKLFILLMFCVCIVWIIFFVVKNSSVLKKVCVVKWNILVI